MTYKPQPPDRRFLAIRMTIFVSMHLLSFDGITSLRTSVHTPPQFASASGSPGPSTGHQAVSPAPGSAAGDPDDPDDAEL